MADLRFVNLFFFRRKVEGSRTIKVQLPFGGSIEDEFDCQLADCVRFITRHFLHEGLD
jgi:hypothetical protein